MAAFDNLFKDKFPVLTRSQRKLLEYILSHDYESIFLNVTDLGKKACVSEATVVRLSKALGFKGFTEFKKELRLGFRNKLTTTSRLERTVKRVSNEEDVLIKVLQTDIENIRGTLEEISVEEFKQFVRSIDSAKRVVIVGMRGINSLAVFFGVALEFFQKNVWVIQPGIGDMWDRLLGLRKGDLVIGISFPRYTKQTVEVMQFAKQKGIKTMAITDSLISPLAQYADHVLTARYKLNSFIESFTAPFSVINALVTALGVYSKRGTMKSLKELEEIWERKQIYYYTKNEFGEVRNSYRLP